MKVGGIRFLVDPGKPLLYLQIHEIEDEDSETMNIPGRRISTRASILRLLFLYLPVLLIAFWLIWNGEGQVEENRIRVRYLLFAWSGLVAFILPYISFPDPSRRICQLGNLPPRALMKRYLYRHRLLVVIALVVLLLTALPASGSGTLPERLLLFVSGGLFLGGIYLYSAARYLNTGSESQQWQESERGRSVSMKLAALAKYPVDPGSIPSLISSAWIAIVGMMGVVAGALLSSLFGGLWGELVWGGFFFLFGLQRCYRLVPEADRLFYQTNAFFGEFFGELKQGKAGPEPLKADQIWWIPTRWRVHGWAIMAQMNRVLPAGRFIAGGHLFLWILAYRDLEGGVLILFWMFFAILHQGLLLLTTDSSLVPVWWLRLLDSPAHWMATRFWVQVRWLLPLLAGLVVMKWLFARFGWMEIAQVGLVYLASAALASIVTGWIHERQVEVNGA